MSFNPGIGTSFLLFSALRKNGCRDLLTRRFEHEFVNAYELSHIYSMLYIAAVCLSEK